MCADSDNLTTMHLSRTDVSHLEQLEEVVAKLNCDLIVMNGMVCGLYVDLLPWVFNFNTSLTHQMLCLTGMTMSRGPNALICHSVSCPSLTRAEVGLRWLVGLHC